MIATTEKSNNTIAPETREFYCRVMTALQQARVPFLVGGAYAFARYTGIVRHTKDFDIFVHPRDFDRALEELKRGAGCSVKRPFPHWLGKGYCGDDFVDVIFSSGNGVARVDDLWFEHAVDEEVLGMPARLCPAEEMVWSKSFILERERYDGGDVAHILRARAEELDWDRLLSRFGSTHWPVLLTHLILFRYIYPGEADRIPARVMDELIRKLRSDQWEQDGAGSAERLCRGTILSRSQYLVDIENWGYRDARLEPVGPMTEEEIEIWTRAADEEVGRPYTEVEEVR